MTTSAATTQTLSRRRRVQVEENRAKCDFDENEQRRHVFPESQISGAARTTTRAVRVVRTAMAVRAARGVETRSTKRKRETAEAVGADTTCPGAPFGVLPLDVMIAHVLRNV